MIKLVFRFRNCIFPTFAREVVQSVGHKVGTASWFYASTANSGAHTVFFKKVHDNRQKRRQCCKVRDMKNT